LRIGGEQVVARSAYATRRPAQRDAGRGEARRLGERAHPDTSPAVWGVSPLDAAIGQGDAGRFGLVGCRSVSRRGLAVDPSAG